MRAARNKLRDHPTRKRIFTHVILSPSALLRLDSAKNLKPVLSEADGPLHEHCTSPKILQSSRQVGTPSE